ncbi:P-loop containing nucleoside triphosphate hydrolase protein [Scheffersomyces xylosifermentans]|uniref:P-loop containing nucleoside triphosphate hydrolase protein n=1 Tax=Scheffersomyces xylosifermentans TaxID=1304137 RepID=UPI00315C717C
MKLFIRNFALSAHRLAKKADPMAEIKNYLGRPSNNLSSGLVGLANVGKSTFFQAITKSTLGNPANYPFATIEPEKSLVVVPSEKLDHYQKLFGSEKKVPSNLTIWDIAGLTRNASSGSGLGNKFLADIRQVDGIFQVVRGFRDDDIVHIEDNKVDPVRDLMIVNDELILKDLEFIEMGIEKVTKLFKRPNANKAEIEQELSVLERIQEMLYEGNKVINESWNSEEIEIINGYNLLTAKPTVYLLNVNEQDYLNQTNEFLPQVEEWISQNSPQDLLAIFSAQYETQLNELNQIEGSAIPQIVDKMRAALHLVSFYTCGPKEAHQWTLREGSTAPEAAGVIHTDLQKTFISALVYKWSDLKDEQPPFNEAQLKSSGKQHRHGKKYVVEDGDVINVKAAGGKTR